jgi:cytochrome c biogenesis protein
MKGSSTDMASGKSSSGLMDTIWNFFASIQLTIVLLLSLAISSIVGTLIPQNADPREYLKAFGEFYFRFFHALDLFDMYHSWWFQLLLLMLVLNIIVCSIDRLSANRKILLVRRPKFTFGRFKNAKFDKGVSLSRPPEKIEKRCQAFWQRKFGHVQFDTTENGFRLFGEKGRWTRFGVYVVHLSVVILLIGGMIGSLFGFEGFVNLAPGDATSQIRLRQSNQVLDLGFTVRCDDFIVSFHENGAPELFQSSLAIVEDGETVVEKDIIVNDPLRYKGVNFYQASYGPLPPKGAKLSFTSKATGMIYQREVLIGKQVALPESLGRFTLMRLDNAATFRGQQIGEAFVGILSAGGKQDQEVILPIRFPSFDKMRGGDVHIAVQEPLLNYFTGLEVSRDPGVWVVYVGFVLMILGCYITFFMTHQQFCIDVSREAEGSRVRIAGIANKNKLAIPRKVSALAEDLVRVTAEEK